MDQRPVGMIALRFANRTFAYERLAKGLTTYASVFSRLMRQYFDPVVKADHISQYVDDIGIAANNAAELPRNIRGVFKSICKAGLKQTIKGAILSQTS